MTERLHKRLAQIGYGSRRTVEAWIRTGRITVNGKPAVIGQFLNEKDQICIDGRLISLSKIGTTWPRVLIYHKPSGEICTRTDPEGRATVFDRLPKVRGRWVSVGRLDIATQGLLLFTDNGVLANRLMHPSYGIEREYAVRVLGEISEIVRNQLLEGKLLDDGLAHFESLIDAGGSGRNHWYHAVLKEGHNREIRRLCASVGITVSRLIRVRYGPVTLPKGLRPGHWRDLDHTEVAALLQRVGMLTDKRNVSCSV